MDARTGKRIRAGRLFDPASGRAIIVALSHGVLLGPSPGLATLEQLRATADSLRAADALMVSPGLVAPLEDTFVGRDRPALVVHADWQSASRSVFRTLADGDVPARAGLGRVAAETTATAEQAAAAGAVAVMTFLFAGFDDPALERDEIRRAARMARACERVGILHIIEPRSARERARPSERADPRVGAYLARIAAEIGADIVKVIHPGSREALAEVVAGCPAPVLLAGGTEAEDPARGEELATDAIATGCRGLVFGRAIVRAGDPAAALARYRAIVHR
jgi:class I fructose-bisphosphate aldolase